ncbi:hypothetical protein [Rhizobium binae]|uniref:hypothetical protein n=1 Tax=Rhizobium binae TaxID=1138190 RepID=UPI001C83C052|nr:hypothetical protein [Rhizobium binae]MBX4961376.1 hypothetical protein [Rhizobium binae]
MNANVNEVVVSSEFKPGWSSNILPETRPLGLVGELVADRWVFECGLRHKPQRIVWTREMANGHPLNHPLNASFWELSRRFFTACRNGKATRKPMAVSTCISVTYVLFQVIDAVMRSGAVSLWTFKAQGFDDLLLALTNRKTDEEDCDYVLAAVRIRFEVVRLLYLLVAKGSDNGVVLNDGFSFVTFSSQEDVIAFAKRINSADENETLDAPPEVVFPLLNAAIEYVTSYADDITTLHHTAERLRPQIERQLRDEYRPRYTRRSQIASALLEALVVRPSWVDESNAVRKTELAQHLDMDRTSVYKKRHQSMFEAAELLLAGGEGQLADEARFLLMSAATKSPMAKGDPAVGPHLAKAIGLPFSGKAGPHAPWPIVNVGKGGRSMDVGTAVSLLWTASYLILASFMADRESETLAIETDCLVYGVDGCYIKTPNFKTRNVDGGSLITQPCPKVVELAVRVLIRLGEVARSEANSNKLLYVTHHHGSSVPDGGDLRYRLSMFAEVCQVDTYQGKKWPIAPHQLRRFFVTSWLHYHEFGRFFKALSTMLDHASIGSTIRYGVRVAQATALSKGQRNLANRIMTRVALGDIMAKGPAARDLLRFAERIRVKALPEDQISEFVVERNHRNDVELTPMPHGYCAWSVAAGQYAACVEKTVRRVGLARPQGRKRSCVCGRECRNFIVTNAFSGFWENSADRHRRIANNSAASPRLREAAKEGLRIAQNHIAKALEEAE